MAILCLDAIGCALSATILIVFPASAIALWGCTVLGGISVASMFATILNLADRRIQITGRVTGWIFVGSSTGGMTVPWVIGQTFESIGPSAVFYVILGDLFVGVVVYIIFMHSSRVRV